MSFLWHGLTEQGAQVPVQVDAQGRVIAVDGTPPPSNWERTGTTLSPAVPGDSVDIGSGNITLNADGSATFIGKVTSASTAFADAGTTLVTKDYLTSGAASGTGTFGYWSRTGTTLSPATAGDAVSAAGGVDGAVLYATDGLGGKTEMIVAREGGTKGFVVQGSGGANGLGSVLIGGTLPSAPNISLNANGSASFGKPSQNSAGDGTYVGAADEAGSISIYSEDESSQDIAGNRKKSFFLGFSGGSAKTKKVDIAHDGSATFAGDTTSLGILAGKRTVTADDQSLILASNGEGGDNKFIVTRSGAYIGTALTSVSSQIANANISLNANGNATFAGNVTAANITFRSADPSFYVPNERSESYDGTDTYTGPELNLLEEIVRLESLVKHLYDVLGQNPPAGWDVWDGDTDLIKSRGRRPQI